MTTSEKIAPKVLKAAKTIAIDVDSVLADVMLIWADEYSKRNKVRVTKKEILSWDISTVLPITPNRIYRYFNHVWKYRWREIPPTEPDIGDVIERMRHKGYRISIITKRERPTAPFVAMWLDRHRIHADELLFVFDSVSKANHPFDVLIDDAPLNFADIIAPKSAILFNQPWNKDFDWPKRINMLSEAEKLL